VHQAGKLQFFGAHAQLADAKAFAHWMAPMRKCEWVVYAKRPESRADDSGRNQQDSAM
jgi:3-phenylpropionate/cinnamic acid dioxygenase small subunit